MILRIEPTMSKQQAPKQPQRTAGHEAFEAFVGEWHAEGWSYGRPDQDPAAPKARRDRWTSTHTARWYTGGFFLVQDEKARLGDGGNVVFDTLSILGVDDRTGECLARTFENHGYQREYRVTRTGNRWSLSGETERAMIEFSDDLATQTIAWEWLRAGKWLPLCDRVATRD